MNKQDLILDFIDGKIEPDHNDVLFEHLYYDEAARTEFTQQMQILLNINKSMELMPVPSIVTQNIFAELGIKTSLWLNFLQRIRKSRFAKTSAIVVGLLLITFSSFYMGRWYYENNFEQYSNGNKYRSNIPVVSSEESIFTSSNNQSSNYGTNNNNKNISYLQNQNYLTQLANFTIIANSIDKYYRDYYNRLITQNSQINSQINSQNVALIGNNTAQIIDQIEANYNYVNKNINISNPQMEKNKYLSNLPTNQYFYNLRTKTFVDLISSLLPDDHKYEISLSNLSTTSALPIGLTPNKKVQFDFNSRYNLNSNSALGLNIGYDYFPMEFTREIQGKQFTQIQSPDLVYLGITYRYNYFESPTNSFMIPYFDFMIGGTQIGPLLKAQIGASIPIWNRIALNLGIHNSLLIYNVDNTIYSTNKLNFVYGINLKL